MNYIDDQSRKSKVLVSIARKHKSNHFDGREKYPQLWWVVSKYPKPLKKVIQFLCGFFGGHELSKTEWGYGGGHADRWCRWCNKLVQVPKTSVYFTNPGAKELIQELDKGKFLGEDLPKNKEEE